MTGRNQESIQEKIAEIRRELDDCKAQSEAGAEKIDELFAEVDELDAQLAMRCTSAKRRSGRIRVSVIIAAFFLGLVGLVELSGVFILLSNPFYPLLWPQCAVVALLLICSCFLIYEAVCIAGHAVKSTR